MAKTNTDKSMRVGMLVTGSLIVLMLFLFFIGSEQKIFARKNEYQVRLENVTGLATGNPVKMSGVTIGVIRDIFLPRDPKEKNVEITLMIDRKYADRVRGDSRVRLKKLGLLAGDSYVDVTPGTPRFAAVEPGALIPAVRQANVDQLMASGEDLVDNLVQISHSMKNILARVDRGEGLLGEITTAPETKQRITDTVLTTLNKTNAALAHMESGRGLVGKLIYDDRYAEQLTASITNAAGSLQSVAMGVQTSMQNGEGMIPALLNDPEGKRRVYELVDNLRTTSSNLATFTASAQTGEGLLPRLMNDKVYADQALGEFSTLVGQLNETVRKINGGEGTAGKLISDPSLYEAVNDILIGINESKLLRWLIRNRQASGIAKRADTAKTAPSTSAPAPAVVPPPPVEGIVIAPVTGTAVAPGAVPPAVIIVPPSDEVEPEAPATTTTAPPAGAAVTSTAPPQ